MVILVYVDDILIGDTHLHHIAATKQFLYSQFHMKDLGPLRYFLGIEVDQVPQGLFLSQKKYTLDLLHSYNMHGCKPLKLPMDPKLQLHTGNPLPKAEPYQRLIGKLIYLTITRPDISYTVHVLSQFMYSPIDVQYQAAIRVLRYLSGSSSQSIFLTNTSNAQLTAYCDSDWAGCPTTRRSTSGFCILLGTSPLSWKAKRQTIVARSSAEAEYRAMALTICEIMWLKQLLKDLGLTNTLPTTLYCDNNAALSIALNPVHHERMKHIEIDNHFIREKVHDKTIQPQYIPSHSQLADIFTKVLPTSQHTKLLSKLGVRSSSS